jgi:hypothetical protein
VGSLLEGLRRITLANSRFLKDEPEKASGVFVEITELAIYDWFTTIVALYAKTVLLGKSC